MANDVAPVERDRSNTREPTSAAKREKDAEVPKMIGRNAGDPRGVQRKDEAGENADCRHGPVAGDDDGSDVEEDWMH